MSLAAIFFNPSDDAAVDRLSVAHFLQYAASATTPSAGRQKRPQFLHFGRLKAMLGDLRFIGFPNRVARET